MEMASTAPPQPAQAPIAAPLPRITIQFCTQCKWMLRAAYYAQELLSTFSLSIGEVALQPSTGGTFIVTIYHQHTPSTTSSSPSAAAAETTAQSTVLWDRKTDGGFPETKDLKRRVRDVIEPGRNLGHVDRDHHRDDVQETTQEAAAAPALSSSAAAAAAAAAGKQDARQEDESQKNASSGIVCEDCA
ncbi:hypothetical protein M440DRAFT_1459410 [Trichoderma longibrachiatum ATCC 18648]|uniref:Selenoprotein domain-containing protein n=1 Tax=Trichoderma longibrachiatum ATCC 18648 TaxID=983965 RepID=A0A2T4CHY7_TRILO|nr:hypothetical protein M440DRAFT_1459410 [Trichoderma longibrachiatum ATCC 18648]